MRFARQHRVADEDRFCSVDALPLLVLVVAIVVSSTTGIGVTDSWFDEQRIIGIFALCVAALIVATCASWNYWSGPPTVLLALLGIGFVSSLTAQRPYVALLEWSMMVVITALVVQASLFRVPKHPTNRGFVWRDGTDSLRFRSRRQLCLRDTSRFRCGELDVPGGILESPIPAQLEALSIPFLFLAWRLAPQGFWRASIFVIAVAWWGCLIGSGSRTSWISLGVALAIVAWCERDRGFAFTRFQCSCAALGGVAFLILFFVLPGLLGLTSAIEDDRFSNAASVGRRAVLWKLASMPPLPIRYSGSARCITPIRSTTKAPIHTTFGCSLPQIRLFRSQELH